ncbi:MAG: hypothetical protein A2583_04910 [Bdellovibrionales bacterium RIFOXYD1_FULL_53_11]|nr:MAG: hypothetical protein A2583_04910 [Bdellovibrionales bacterium RIFOXYD1_FULL_53_11]
MMQFFRIAIRNLIKNRTRTLIVGGAITGVTMLMAVLMGIISGIEQTMISNATAMMSGHVNVAGFFKISQSSAAPLVTKTPELYKMVRETLPEADYVIDRVKAFGKLISDTTTIQVPLWGVDYEMEKRMLGRLALAHKRDYIKDYKPAAGDTGYEGSFAGLKERGTVVMFSAHARKLGVRVGDTVTISMFTQRNQSNTKDVRVAAVLANLGIMSSFNVFMNKEDARELYQMSEDTTGQLMIYLKDARQNAAAEELLRKAASARGWKLMEKDPQAFWMKFDRVAGESWTGQRLDITTWQDETSFLKWIIDIFHVLTFIMITVLMVIVMLGLMNTLWMSIRERTSEIGTLRAIGLQKRGVMIMFMLESMALSVASALAGTVLGSLLNRGLDAIGIPINSEAFQMFLMSNRLRVIIEPGDMLLTFCMITVFLTIGALYPSWKAGKMKPITAINQV